MTEVDLLERPMDSGSWDGETLTLRPFQIVTLRYRLVVEEGRVPSRAP